MKRNELPPYIMMNMRLFFGESQCTACCAGKSRLDVVLHSNHDQKASQTSVIGIRVHESHTLCTTFISKEIKSNSFINCAGFLIKTVHVLTLKGKRFSRRARHIWPSKMVGQVRQDHVSK